MTFQCGYRHCRNCGVTRVPRSWISVPASTAAQQRRFRRRRSKRARPGSPQVQDSGHCVIHNDTVGRVGDVCCEKPGMHLGVIVLAWEPCWQSTWRQTLPPSCTTKAGGLRNQCMLCGRCSAVRVAAYQHKAMSWPAQRCPKAWA